MRVLAGVAHRLNACVDTHVSSLELLNGELCATRWFYRQRIEGVFVATHGPGLCYSNPAASSAWTGAPAEARVEQVPVTLPEGSKRTEVIGIRAPMSDAQTIRPDSNLLFVAGAGWTKKQADGKPHVDQAENSDSRFPSQLGCVVGWHKSWSISREKARLCWAS